MATVSELKRERRLPDDQMDEVIVRATRLQEKARAPEAGVTVSELKEVGQELDIDPRFVEAAIAELERERVEAEAARKRARSLRLKLLAGAGALAVVALLVAWSGARDVRAAQARTEYAGTSLWSVLERQARLLPQLLALSGGAADELERPRRRFAAALDLRERAAAADELAEAMTGALARLPPPRDPSQGQLRLSLQHELVGAHNRVTIEHRRYQEALAGWRAVARGPAARLAVTLGLAPAPPPP